jgi:hypothetical protein
VEAAENVHGKRDASVVLTEIPELKVLSLHKDISIDAIVQFQWFHAVVFQLFNVLPIH